MRTPTTNLWEVSIQFEGANSVTRRVTTELLRFGASPKAQIRVPRPGPDFAFEVSKETKSGDVSVSVIGEAQVEFRVGGKWVKKSEFRGKKVPELRFGNAVYELREIEQTTPFRPVVWAARFDNSPGSRHALWHFRGAVLIETLVIENKKQNVAMKCGYDFHWDPSLPNRIMLKEHNGETHSLELKQGPKDSLQAQHGMDVFLLTGLPMETIPSGIAITAISTPEGPRVTRFGLGVMGFRLAFFGLVYLWPQPVVEEMPPIAMNESTTKSNRGTDLPTITVENAPNSGGNGRRGGGGVQSAQSRDARGGSGRTGRVGEKNLKAYKAQRGKGNGFRTTVNKAKPEDTGLSLGLSRGSKVMNSALSRLDSGVASGRVKGAGRSGGMTGGGGSASEGSDGVLGVLGKAGGRAGGGGMGIGGLGTKGFGGGGGGGRGAGFGNEVGDGLGRGHGTRRISFGGGQTVVRGGLERAEIEAVIEENLGQIRYCYNQALRTSPGLAGKVSTAFTIGPSGRVKSTRITGSTLGAPSVDSCISSRIASWQFPHPRGGGVVDVSRPFMLKSN